MPSEHYSDADPATPSARRTVRLVLADRTLDLVTDRGVFSHERIDPGTRYLLRQAPMPRPTDTEVLDLGCGYGAIALAVAGRAPAARVWAVDVNARALALCRENAATARLDNVEVRHVDDVPADVGFDVIYCNPPIRIGKPALHDLLLRWLRRLAPGGRAYLVVQRHLGSDSLARWLAEQGLPATRLGSRVGYRLLGVEPAET